MSVTTKYRCLALGCGVVRKLTGTSFTSFIARAISNLPCLVVPQSLPSALTTPSRFHNSISQVLSNLSRRQWNIRAFTRRGVRRARLVARRVGGIDRIVPYIGIKVHLVLIPDRVDLQEPARASASRTGPCNTTARAPAPRPGRYSRTGPLAVSGDAPWVVAVDRDRVAVHVGDRDDRALVVGEQGAAPAAREIVVPDERIVGAGSLPWM